MGIQVRLIITMALLVVLPLSITLISWSGLKQMDQELHEVAEEFTEARSLQPVYMELGLATYALQQNNPNLDADALASLERAEAALRTYLAEQFRGVSDAEHQADESSRASEVLAELGALTGQNWPSLPREERLDRAAAVRDGLKGLYADADAGVLQAPLAARAARQRTIGLVLIASLSAALVCVGFSIWSTKSVFRRLRELRDAMSQDVNGRSSPSARDVPGMVDQLEELNRRMIDRIEDKNRELLRRERMAGIGLLAADVAHEINNPLNAMLGLSELSLRTSANGPIDETERKELHESLTVIRREVLRCSGIVQRLMAMVRGSGKPQRIDAAAVLRESVSIAKAARPDRASCFVLVGPETPVLITIPPEDIRQIVLTLLINAADAVGHDGRIEVDIVETDQEVWIRVRDNGQGFTEETKANFRIPFSTTRQADGGTGLGLSIAFAVAADIGVDIRADSKGIGCGSSFIVAIPSSGANE